MKRLLCLVALLFAGSAAPAAPPKLTVLPNGELQIVTGGTTLTVKADGSVLVKSAAIDLTIPGTDGPGPKPDPVKPVDPVKPDELAQTAGTLYGSDVDPDKAGKAAKLATFWYKALSIVDGATTYADLKTKLRAIPTLPDTDLKAIRDLLREEMKKALGADSEPVDKVKTRELYTRFAKLYEGLPNG